MFESALDDQIRDAYLARLGLRSEPPSAAALQLLTQRQVERVPYETLWIQAGDAWDIDPHEAARRIALESRGGYCYHLNGAFGLLLAALGYSVRGHVGGVHGPDGPVASEWGNHLVLTVDQLPTDANPGGEWYVDAGLGDALHDPLPLIAGRHEQPPFTLSLETIDEGSWHLTHDPAGGFGGMRWTMRQARLTDFAAQHRWLSTSPESGFVRVPMAERRDATGVEVVRGRLRSRVGEEAFTSGPLTRSDWFEKLTELFGLCFDADAADRLWAAAIESHRQWEAEQD